MDIVAGMVLLVFIGTYIAISTEKVNRTAMSLLGMGIVGIILWAAGAGTFTLIASTVDWGTILFVTSMMIIVTIASASGMFQYLALKMVGPTRCDTKRLFITFLTFVFVISFFFDTASTMLIMGPLTIELCKAIEIDFRPFLIAESMVTNFASIPSVVGAVPNLVIAERASVDPGFMFIVLMPLAVILFIFSIPLFLYFFEDMLEQGSEEVVNQMLFLDPTYMIKSRKEFYLSIIAMIILVLGFTLGQTAQFEPSMIAIIVASVLLLTTKEWVDEILMRVNWGTVFFLVGLFGLVAALEITGVIHELGVVVGEILGDNLLFAIIFMTWIPALLSAVIDNIPVSAVLAPIALQFASLSPIIPLVLIFAVNIGGFILPIGSPATILALALSERAHNPISFKQFMRVATTMGLIMLAIGTGWFVLVGMII